MRLGFQHSYASLPSHFYAKVNPTAVANPQLVVFNRPLAWDLGLEPETIEHEAAALFSGNRLPEDANPIAMAYAGHQFGAFVPRLGDGRAILLGEIKGRDGILRDIQLKGAGLTPFSRTADGRAVLGPMLREYLISEAMYALGIPTTRSLAVVTTGERVYRDEVLPGAVLTRVAASHVRVGTFQYFAARGDQEGLRELLEYVVTRHYPAARETAAAGSETASPDREGAPAAREAASLGREADSPGREAASPGREAVSPALAVLKEVTQRQLALITRWMLVGFIHGVMNTDNMAISGETIDYGPCAFMDEYDPKTVFSSIDHNGRYAYANQPAIAQWNLARFAETLLPLIDPDADKAVALATEVLEPFIAGFDSLFLEGMRRKIGLSTSLDGDAELVRGLLTIMQKSHSDFTLTFRGLTHLAADSGEQPRLLQLFSPDSGIEGWLQTWRARLANDPRGVTERVATMRAANPAYIPRNHRVDAALKAAESGDYAPFRKLLGILQRPYEDQPEAAAEYGQPPQPTERVLQTFCGT